jgi:hypothetical protein
MKKSCVWKAAVDVKAVTERKESIADEINFIRENPNLEIIERCGDSQRMGWPLHEALRPGDSGGLFSPSLWRSLRLFCGVVWQHHPPERPAWWRDQVPP